MAKTVTIAGLRTKINKLKAQPQTPKRAEAIKALQVELMKAARERVMAR